MVRARVPRTATRERGTPVAGRGRRQDAGSEGGKAIRKKAEGRTAFPGELPPFYLLPSTFYLLPSTFCLASTQRSPQRNCSTVNAATGTASARSVRWPSV